MAAFGGAAWAPIWDSGGRVARLARHLGVGGPRRTPRRAPDREGQSAAMKWVRIDETWHHSRWPWRSRRRFSLCDASSDGLWESYCRRLTKRGPTQVGRPKARENDDRDIEAIAGSVQLYFSGAHA